MSICRRFIGIIWVSMGFFLPRSWVLKIFVPKTSVSGGFCWEHELSWDFWQNIDFAWICCKKLDCSFSWVSWKILILLGVFAMMWFFSCRGLDFHRVSRPRHLFSLVLWHYLDFSWIFCKIFLYLGILQKISFFREFLDKGLIFLGIRDKILVPLGFFDNILKVLAFLVKIRVLPGFLDRFLISQSFFAKISVCQEVFCWELKF